MIEEEPAFLPGVRPAGKTSVAMATNGSAPVLEALSIMRSNVKKGQREKTHDFLN